MANIECPHCQKIHKFAGDPPFGKNATCSGCGQRFVIEMGCVQREQETEVPIAQGSGITLNSTGLPPRKKASSKKGIRVDWLGVGYDLIRVIVYALVIIVALVVLSFFTFGNQPPTDRFLTDNAVGATANALEKIEHNLAKLVYMFGFLFSYFVLKDLVKFLEKQLPSLKEIEKDTDSKKRLDDDAHS